MYQEELKIPKERIAVLIGKKGSTKKDIEKIMHTSIKIDSLEGDITIKGKDYLNVSTTKNIVNAIGRGFNPKIAEQLSNEENTFEIINIPEFSKKSKKKLLRLKSRVIGTKGRAWKLIEQMTNTDLSVYGKTVSVIGNIQDVEIARRAIKFLLAGSEHGNVYRWIEKQKAIQKSKNFDFIFL